MLVAYIKAYDSQFLAMTYLSQRSRITNESKACDEFVMELLNSSCKI